MIRYSYIVSLSAFFLVSGLLHLLRPEETDELMRRVSPMRLVGVGLLLMATPGLVFREPYFVFLSVVLAFSGLARVLFPTRVARFMVSAYSRRVHGVLLILGGILNLLLPIWLLQQP